MLDTLFPFLGGLGLFLIGMMLLSEGLVAFAGGSLKQILLAFTGRPIKAFASGALITALAQSSTATFLVLPLDKLPSSYTATNAATDARL